MNQTTAPRRRGAGLTPETLRLGEVWALSKKRLDRHDQQARVKREQLQAIEREHAQRYMDAVAQEGCRVIC